MRLYAPDGKKVTLETASGQAVEVEFETEDDAILFFEAMKQVMIEDSQPQGA